jgi:hypothetical protein
VDPALFPIVTALIALAGVALGAGLTWWGNRSNARLQIDAQRQLAADTRRYERRRKEMAPLAAFVRERVAAFRAPLIAAEQADAAAFQASAETLSEKMHHRFYELSQLAAVGGLAPYLEALGIAEDRAADVLIQLLQDRGTRGALPAPGEEEWQRIAKDVDNGISEVTDAALALERAIDTYLDDLPGTALAKRPKP